jgi:serine/threonine protein phosphatase 1
MKTYVTTDTHGCNKELIDVLNQASFDYANDTLIHIGDCTDRGPDSFGVIETLLKIKNLIPIQGNHDAVMLSFINTGRHQFDWGHGAYKTISSYIDALGLSYPEVYVHQTMNSASTNFTPKYIPDSHKAFFRNQLDYYIDAENRLFVHAGYDPMESIEQQDHSMLIWDRELVQHLGSYIEDGKEVARYPDVNDFKRVFIGHTPTITFRRKFKTFEPVHIPKGCTFKEPMYMGQLVNLDTGCCFGNKLSLIDITDDENHIIYQSK